MSITDNKKYSFSFSMIDIKKIDHSPADGIVLFIQNARIGIMGK
jgi:hypothetical protein